MSTFNINNNQKQIANEMIANVKQMVSGFDPNDKESVLVAVINSLALSISGYTREFEDAFNNQFVLTADGDSLDRVGESKGVGRLPATSSRGLISFPIDVGVLLPLNSTFLINAKQYTNTTSAAAQAYNNTINDIFYNSSTDKTEITFNDLHNLGSGFKIVINSQDYFVSELLSEFKIALDTDLTGSISVSDVANYSLLVVQVSSVQLSAGLDQIGDSKVTSNAVANVDGAVTYAGIIGSSNQETNDQYRVRLAQFYNVIRGNGLNDSTFQYILDSNGYNYIRFNFPRATDGGDPDVGEHKIYVLRNDDSDVDSATLTELYNLALPYLGAAFDPAKLTIQNATKITQNFNISLISPNSSTMEEAVRTNLKIFFTNNAFVGRDVTFNRYNDVLRKTVDAEGKQLREYTINSPTGTITTQNNEKIVLGTVTFV